jgi:hypothetical protein
MHGMSQDFSQYDQPYQEQFRPAAAPPKKGCNRGCLILLILLGLIVAGLVGMFVWLLQNIASGMTNDPQVIAKRLTDWFPKAKLPHGYEGMVGLKVTVFLDMDLLVFGKDDTQVQETGEVLTGDALVLFSFKVPGVREIDMAEALDAGNNGGKLIEKKPLTLKAGEYEFSASMHKVLRDTGNNEKKVFYQIIVPLGNDSVVMIQNDQEKLDQAGLEEFLKSIAPDCPVARKVEK